MKMSNHTGIYYVASVGVAWERTLPSKQTLFPVWGDKEERKPRAGIPPPEVQSSVYTLRATKGVNMHPFPTIQITKMDGTPYTQEEEVRLSLVGTDKLFPPQGSCTCKGKPILSESKPFQLTQKEGDTYCKFRGGYVELKKLQIGCCTGSRGHGSALCLKVEFVRENSPLKGLVCYSLPIEVGAKGPFAKAITGVGKGKSSPERTENSGEMPVVLKSKSSSIAPYEGAEEIISLLTSMNLQQYIHLFIQNEVDLQAFLQLTDEDLTQIGINKIGPKVKILKQIEKLRGNTALPAPSDLSPTEPPIFPSLEAPFTHPSLLDDNNFTLPEPTPKRRKFGSSMENFTPPQIVMDRFPNVTFSPQQVDTSAQLSLYLYLSNVATGKKKLKKTLFMVRSKRDRQATEDIVQQIHSQVISKLKQKGKKVVHEGKAQMMLVLQPDKNGDWVARSQFSGQLWSFKKGDYIKIDNHHDVNVQISVYHYFISESGEPAFTEDKGQSPKQFPELAPGASLEIGIDDKEGRTLTPSNMESDPSETFAVTHNGKLVMSYNSFTTQTCIFSFKRRKSDMKKVESLDDFQKELFLSKCLEVDSL